MSHEEAYWKEYLHSSDTQVSLWMLGDLLEFKKKKPLEFVDSLVSKIKTLL